jgi:hypothetical protein
MRIFPASKTRRNAPADADIRHPFSQARRAGLTLAASPPVPIFESYSLSGWKAPHAQIAKDAIREETQQRRLRQRSAPACK